MKTCRICQTPTLEVLLDCGPQPISNRFLSRPDESQQLHPLIVGLCEACAVLQLVDPLPGDELAPPFDWITYNEPEGHLDDLVARLTNLPDFGSGSRFIGVSYKEDTTFDRLDRLQFPNHYRLDVAVDLDLVAGNPGIESIQQRLTPAVAARLGKQHGQADVVIARHILEHAENPAEFVAALRQLQCPNGRVVFEVPDCTRALDQFDYTTLWEEHLTYFTPTTYRHALDRWGMNVEEFVLYPYPTENSLVAITRPDRVASEAPTESLLEAERVRARRFAGGFSEWRESTSGALREFSRRTGPIAMFGAGHMSCMYLQLLGIADCVEFVVDDHPRKKGMFMPGSTLPIVGSERLRDDKIKLCLSSLAPESEVKVIARQQDFICDGGVFASIFPGKENSLNLK